MCRVLDVSVSGYYQWTQRSESNRSIETRKVQEAIKRIHKESREIYGSPRIAICLQEEGFRCSKPRTARLMRSMGIRSKVAKKFKVTTDSNHKEPIAHNLLDQVFVLLAVILVIAWKQFMKTTKKIYLNFLIAQEENNWRFCDVVI